MLWLRGFANSRDKWKPLYQYYWSAYGYQTCQISTITVPLATKLCKMMTYLERLPPIKHMTLWPCGLATSWGKQKHYISTTRMLTANTHGRIVIFLNGFLPIKSHEPLITWSWEITWQTKNIYPQYNSAYGHQTS